MRLGLCETRMLRAKPFIDLRIARDVAALNRRRLVALAFVKMKRPAGYLAPFSFGGADNRNVGGLPR